VSIGGSTSETPGRADRSETSVATARRSTGPWTWCRRALLTTALSFGAGALLAVWSGSAHAHEVESTRPCSSTQVEQTPLSDPGADAGSQEGSFGPSSGAGAAPPTCDAAPAPDAGIPPPPVPVDLPVDPLPVAVPAVDALPAAVPPVDPADTDPAPTDPAPTDPAPTDPAPTDPAPTDLAPTDLAPTDLALADLPAVTTAVPDAVVTPVLCSQRGFGAVAATEVIGAAVSHSWIDRQVAGNGSATTGATLSPPGPEPSGAPPVSPSSPPAPVRLPAPPSTPAPGAPGAPGAPAGPAGPAGPSATAFSVSSSCGTGHIDHADSIDAVLGARVAASLAQAALRSSSGFAGAVVGGADDPGVRPG
jgi:hypothetical protein